MRTLSLPQLFVLATVLMAALLVASVLSAWTGPTASPPNGNVAAPVNVGTTDQVKDAGLSVNALTVFGSQYIQTKLGIGVTSPVVALDVSGTLKLADGGELCQAVSEGAIRYNTTSNIVEYCDGASWSALAAGSGSIPSGAVMPFNLSACPSGWTEYTAAYGRFIRGIDKSGTSIDPSGQRAEGNTQSDDFKSHAHTFTDDIGAQGQYAYVGGGESYIIPYWQGSSQDDTTSLSGGSETRPKNVALLYCEKS